MYVGMSITMREIFNKLLNHVLSSSTFWLTIYISVYEIQNFSKVSKNF